MFIEKIKSKLRKTLLYRKAHSIYHSVKEAENPYLKYARPGHYYSPIPDIFYIQKNKAKLFNREIKSCPGINLAADSQIKLVKTLSQYAENIPFPHTQQEGFRYFYDNEYFGSGSADILYALMQFFKPKRIIEAGSGFSSAAMLDINDLLFDGNIEFTFIEPYPEERLLSLLTEKDKSRHKICPDIAQNISAEFFSALDENDIFFIDSSHVAKTGSDVVYLLTEILPILRKGVIIHIHDIFWPFEYPEEWVLTGRAWSEAYLVKAFLQFNEKFEILLFNSYLAIHHKDLMSRLFPHFLDDCKSSLWIKKVR
jgi:predicted O-methyltransferase YrrM